MTESGAQLVFSATGAWLAVGGLAGLVGAGLYGYFAALFSAVPAARRGTLLLSYAALPGLVAILVSVLLYFPALAAQVLPQHCHGDPCVPHAPEFAASAAYIASILALAFVGVWTLVLGPLRQLHRALRRSALLRRLAAEDAGGRFRVIDSDAPAAWCEGLWRPGIFVSRGLLHSISAAELDIVLAHEQAHAERRDNLLGLVLHWMTRSWPRSARQSLRRDFTLAAELACDAQAARTAGSGGPVAAVIANLDSRRSRQAAQRVGHLQHGEPDGGSAVARAWLSLGMLWMVQAGSFTYLVHFCLEWLNGRI
ncbi:MAG: M56 family metallopeptidase [Gammaproteobacteria bacterium]|jgi:hypothetical protein|nr:M56 family metallopeptidase [Gammaproteobacteria bacterium]